MGPRSVERGKLERLADAKHILDASMGPRSVERGKKGGNRSKFSEDQLQWGRVLLNAERVWSPSKPVNPFELQWGRVLLNAERQ